MCVCLCVFVCVRGGARLDEEGVALARDAHVLVTVQRDAHLLAQAHAVRGGGGGRGITRTHADRVCVCGERNEWKRAMRGMGGKVKEKGGEGGAGRMG